MGTQRVAIEIEGLGKLYQLGSHFTSASTLGEVISTGARRLLRKRDFPEASNPFWALKDVSFKVREGEAVGIIGRNGAGKSTLLKILSRITEPTTGRLMLRGRLGSLLEVGTGFHPELTGKENVYLNGAILGMKKIEIDRKFDEIVAFSELERFLSTPVKRYSSGMQVRLAFAVAAHLDTEILIADEVLAVGDTAFQRKCLGKLEGVARQGRTVLFVSHSLAAVRSLCTRGILLREGSVSLDGDITSTIREYLRGLEEASYHDVLERSDRRGTGAARLSGIEVSTPGRADGVLETGSPANFLFHLDRTLSGVSLSFTIYDQLGQPVVAFDSAVPSPVDSTGSPGTTFRCDIDELLLIPGRYRVNAAIARGNSVLDHLEAAIFFDVEHGAVNGRPVSDHANYGSTVMAHRWTSPD